MNYSYGIVIIIAIFVILIYYPALYNGLVSDDFNLNEQTEVLSNVFSTVGGLPLRLLGKLSLYLDHLLFGDLLFGDNYTGYHFSGILIHILTSVIVYFIAASILNNKTFGFVSALFYAAHFANVGSVNWISDRWTLVSAFFTLLSFLFFTLYYQKQKRRFLLLSCLAFVFALLSKESALTLPLILFLFVLLSSPGKAWNPRLNKALRESRFHFLLLSIYLAIRFIFLPGGAYSIKLTKILLSPFYYFSYLISPYDPYDLLNHWFEINPNSVRQLFKLHLGSAGLIFFSSLALGIIFLILVLLFKKASSILKFSLIWIGLAIMPFCAWFDLRWLNPATFGVALLLSYLLFSLFKKFQKLGRLRAKLLVSLIIGAVLFSYSLSTRERLFHWRQAHETVQEILKSVKNSHPSVPHNSIFIFLNLPDMQNNAFVFRQGIENAIKLLYQDNSLSGFRNPVIKTGILRGEERVAFLQSCRDDIIKSGRGNNPIFIFEYDHRKILNLNAKLSLLEKKPSN